MIVKIALLFPEIIPVFLLSAMYGGKVNIILIMISYLPFSLMVVLLPAFLYLSERSTEILFYGSFLMINLPQLFAFKNKTR
ncbi:hypothetical protein DRF57_08065 [Chryseobacterium rhizosphaerae]|jgi:hypothetical protein|uniref:ComEC/Rec2-related protein domain-containing protein n=1 Tax=Chryseobacterium rhizosphaerae TaxID=395937 RepID=A0ABX9ILS2_9FLAO|nr:hypothetical protein DRF57_08065 [Chryseobacterium rhizosphaerae]